MSNHLEKLKDPFSQDQVEFRIGRCGEGQRGIWAECLAYISARAILDRLDEVCGVGNWKVSYEFIQSKGVICNLSVRIEDEWVTKQDGAEMTEIESFKGGISSALKRAGSAWGIGRYLYSLSSAFVEVVDKGVTGSLYGKTKEGKIFYWLPPPLPDWALPPKSKTMITTVENTEQKTRQALVKQFSNIAIQNKIPVEIWEDYLRSRGAVKGPGDLQIPMLYEAIKWAQNFVQQPAIIEEEK